MMIIMILNAVTTTLFKRNILLSYYFCSSRGQALQNFFFLSLVLLEITEIVSFYNFGAKLQIIREIFVEKYVLPEN